MLENNACSRSSVVTKNEPESVVPAVIVFFANAELNIISVIKNNCLITWLFPTVNVHKELSKVSCFFVYFSGR